MNQEKLKQLQAQVRIGGKGTARRKKKVVHRTATTDDKKLQSSLKKLSVRSQKLFLILSKKISWNGNVTLLNCLWPKHFHEKKFKIVILTNFASYWWVILSTDDKDHFLSSVDQSPWYHMPGWIIV